jgi:hypothetical protein
MMAFRTKLMVQGAMQVMLGCEFYTKSSVSCNTETQALYTMPMTVIVEQLPGCQTSPHIQGLLSSVTHRLRGCRMEAMITLVSTTQEINLLVNAHRAGVTEMHFPPTWFTCNKRPSWLQLIAEFRYLQPLQSTMFVSAACEVTSQPADTMVLPAGSCDSDSSSAERRIHGHSITLHVVVVLVAVVLHPAQRKVCSGSRTTKGGRYAALLLLQCMWFAGLHCRHGMHMECGCCATHSSTTAFFTKNTGCAP